MRVGLLVVLLVAGWWVAAGAELLDDAARADAALEDDLRHVFVDALEGNTTSLGPEIAALELRDQERRHHGLRPTGLTDDARYLAAGLLPTRDARQASLEALLDADPDPVVRRLAEHRLEADDGAAADRLLADDRHNRRASVLNDAVRPLGVLSGGVALAILNPFLLAGSAVDSVITTASNLWSYNRLSTPEREALARYRTALAREPRTEDAPEIARAIRRLGQKRAEAVCTGTVSLGEKTLDADDLDHARFYLDEAAQLDGCADKAAEPRERLNARRATHLAREEAGRWPADEPLRPKPGLETFDYEDLALATAAGDPGAMIEAAGRFRQRHPDSRFEPSARWVVAVARHLAGLRAAGREALAEVADDDGSLGRHARAILDSPDYDRLGAIRDAERRHSRETARWVLLGGQLDGRTAVYSAAHLGADTMRSAQTLGIFNVIGVATRAWQAWRKDPVSNQAIIDRGEEFLAREPTSPDAPDVHGRLADAYERAGLWHRALMHLRAAGHPDAKRVARLEGKLADDLLTEANRRGGNPLLLETIVEHFADTRAAEKAREHLRDRLADGEAALDRELLASRPSLLGPDALDLDPRLLDGERENGELAEKGVALSAGTLRLTLEDESESGEHVETRTLTAEGWDRARAAAREALYEQLLTRKERDPETGRFERYIPVYLQGGLGDDGLSVSPGVKLRRYRTEDPSLYE
jgi:hypothetical protein